MSLPPIVQRVFRLLRSRVALNIYFWAFALWLAFNLNENNERIFHYGIIYSPWYVPVMLGMLVIQWILIYTNNLWLVPQFLAKGKRWQYAIGLTVLVCCVALGTTILLKAATPHMNTMELQHPGFTATVLSRSWNLGTIVREAQNFLISDLMFVFVFTAAWYMQDYARQQKALRLSEQARTETELAFLKNQINPHFLFNTLNNIYGLALQKSDGAPEAILKLSAMLRYLMYESSASNISFEKERAAIEAYVEIETLRLPDDANIHLSMYADRDYQLPPLLWLPLLENAFKHGTRLIGIPIMISFSMRIENSRLVMKCSNYYDTMNEAKDESGIGLSNLRKRLSLLYPGRHTLETGRDGNTYSAELKIELT